MADEEKAERTPLISAEEKGGEAVFDEEAEKRLVGIS